MVPCVMETVIGWPAIDQYPSAEPSTLLSVKGPALVQMTAVPPKSLHRPVSRLHERRSSALTLRLSWIPKSPPSGVCARAMPLHRSNGLNPPPRCSAHGAENTSTASATTTISTSEPRQPSRPTRRRRGRGGAIPSSYTAVHLHVPVAAPVTRRRNGSPPTPSAPPRGGGAVRWGGRGSPRAVPWSS